MRPIVAVDARISKTGIGTYTLNLLSAIRSLDRGFLTTAIIRSQDREAIAPLCDEILIADVPIYGVREQFSVQRAARNSSLLHVPHYNIPVLYRGALVVTIHDLTHLVGPDFRKSAKAWLYALPMLQMASRKAAALITVSEYSKDQIVRRLGVHPDKITVIYNGVSARFHSMHKNEIRPAPGVDRPYILYVGSLKPHKNLTSVIHAFHRLRSRCQLEHLLVLVGDDRKNRSRILQECRDLGLIDSVRHIPWLSEDALPSIYAGADLLVMASKSEGFGLPVVEAMACGTPVVCSHAGSLPEIGGDAALYFDPYNTEEIAAAIERVIVSQGLRLQMQGKGLEQAAKFKWEECARKHVKIYNKILECQGICSTNPDASWSKMQRVSH